MKYRTMLGEEFDLDRLPEEHRDIVERVRGVLKLSRDPDEVSNFVLAQGLRIWGGLPFRERRRLPVRWILRDLEARRLVKLGFARVPSYRDQLEEIIEERFGSAAEFCQATGLSTSLVSHVLNGDKNVSMEALEKALVRIGFRIRLEPVAPVRRKRLDLARIAELIETALAGLGEGIDDLAFGWHSLQLQGQMMGPASGPRGDSGAAATQRETVIHFVASLEKEARRLAGQKDLLSSSLAALRADVARFDNVARRLVDGKRRSRWRIRTVEALSQGVREDLCDDAGTLCVEHRTGGLTLRVEGGAPGLRATVWDRGRPAVAPADLALGPDPVSLTWRWEIVHLELRVCGG